MRVKIENTSEIFKTGDIYILNDKEYHICGVSKMLTDIDNFYNYELHLKNKEMIQLVFPFMKSL